MTPPNFTPQSADVALDPMAGTLQTGRIVFAPDFRSMPSVPAPRPCHCIGPQPGEKLCPCALRAASDSFARAQTRPLGLDAAQAGLFAPEAPAAAVNVCILALDLGTKTGYAVRRRDGAMRYGTMDFTPRKSWTPGQRWARFRGWLADMVATFQIDAIVYERVVFGHSSAASSDVYGGFKALVELTADTHNLTLSSVAVPTVKKHFTGSGRADKDAMMAQARVRGFNPDSHNAADALAVLDWAVAQEKAA